MTEMITREAIEAVLENGALTDAERAQRLAEMFAGTLAELIAELASPEDGEAADGAANAEAGTAEGASEGGAPEGYVEAGAARAALDAAVASAVQRAREEFAREYRAPDPRESDEYRALAEQFDEYRARQAARLSPEFRDVKPKFFDAVYDRIDRGPGALPLEEQLAALREGFAEFFLEPEPARRSPSVVLPVGTPAAPAPKMTLAEAMRRANAGERVDVGRVVRQ